VIEDAAGAVAALLQPRNGPCRALKNMEGVFMRTILRVALLLILFTAAAAIQM
jgi:hypothetical protein